ncbi:hypothetical protein ACFY3V_33240 [Streptosporangium sp. NPDC000095]|uniref:hypothetical protein n=1 Tax=Streptosporangium sp. NPDC000095 TaxID=3366184 RepID=UPI0036AB6E95
MSQASNRRVSSNTDSAADPCSASARSRGAAYTFLPLSGEARAAAPDRPGIVSMTLPSVDATTIRSPAAAKTFLLRATTSPPFPATPRSVTVAAVGT